MGSGGIRIENPRSRVAMEEFARLPFLVYADRKAWWPPDIQNEVDLLSRRSPLSPFLEIEPFMARAMAESSRASARWSTIATTGTGRKSSGN